MLNRDYISSVQGGDVARYEEILAQDYYCLNPDGSLVDRKTFLQQTARPVAISTAAPVTICLPAQSIGGYRVR
jgi:hypothetical protein